MRHVFKPDLLPALLVAAALLAPVEGAAAPDNTYPVPLVTIYPGDTIKDGMLAERERPANFVPRFAVVEDRAALVGKMARRTLLPGQPIPVNAVGEPRIIANGAMVTMVFKEGALTITTYGTALQAGGIGDVIPVRNMESGVTVSGVVQPDGTVRVSNG
jgi:flagella basal body P-ring formation protein FlgA